MKHNGKFLATAAGIVQLLSLTAYFIVILFQRFFKTLFTGQSEALEVFSFPIAQSLQILLLTCGVLLVVLAVYAKGRSLWAEILAILLIIVLCPLVARFGGILENMLIGNKGVEQLISFSTLQSVTGFPLMFSGMASSLALVASGMSLAAKKLS